MSTDDAMLDELLGAYALDAVEPDEAVAVESYLERSPGAADEVGRAITLVAPEERRALAFLAKSVGVQLE